MLVVPLVKKLPHKEQDTKNLISLLSTPIDYKLMLGELPKVRLHLWNELATILEKMGIKGIKLEELNQQQNGDKTHAPVQPVLISKVGEYCDGEDGNITLVVEYNNVKTLSILDSGANIAIATKSLWEAWGKPAIRRMQMKLQLIDGHLEVPLGLLEGIIISTCGIKFTHTFAMVDFGRKTAYDRKTIHEAKKIDPRLG